MRLPILDNLQTSRDMTDVFGGYNHSLRISQSEFYDMKNLTSTYYPVLSPRGKRGTYGAGTNPTALIAKDSLCFIDGRDFVMNEYRVDIGLADHHSARLVSMGAYVIILTYDEEGNSIDKKYVNTLNLDDYGDIEEIFESTTDVTFQLCAIDGKEYTKIFPSNVEPPLDDSFDYWLDTSSTPNVLKQYSSSSATWVNIATTYIKISATGIGKGFEVYDGVTISGITKDGLQDLNNTMPIWEKGDDYIVVVGILDKIITQTTEEGSIKVERKMPNLDFITESGNRLWGCKYGVALNGQVVNEIYACKLGDFKNWNSFMGISTDSYVASCGSDGPFTGAITHLGYPLFFKENCMHKVYGNFPSNFQIQTTACRGVQKGCDRSLAIVNETLFYKARSAVCAYDGSLPVEISAQLGDISYSDAVAGAHGNKYYISMKDTAGQYSLFVFDTAKGMWHKEDSTRVDAFCSCRGELYYIENGVIRTMFGSGTPDKDAVEWMAETGVIGTDSPDKKYISKLNIRMSLAIGTRVHFYIQYDSSGQWEHLFATTGINLRTFTIPARPRRCDHLRIRIVGKGEAKIYSIAKTIEEGSGD